MTARFPDDQAEIVFSDVFVEQLADLAEHDQIDVLAEVHRLCEQPEGRHRLAAPLAGWNTLVVLSQRFRVVYRASWHTGVGLIEVLRLGPRRESEVYDTALALASTGQPDPHEALRAALERARSRVAFPGLDVVLRRAGPRCGLVMPRAGVRCIRARGHPGAHRSR